MPVNKNKYETPGSDFVIPGFSEPSSEYVYRMLLATQGLERTGKSEFALSAPGPMAYINLDMGLEGVIEKWMKKKKIVLASFNIPPLYDDNPQFQTVVTPKATYLQWWNKVREAYNRALDSKARTVVVDTAGDMWELMRLAEFGQLSPAADIRRAYNSLNSLYRGLIRSAYDTDKNLILIHKMKKEYEKKILSVNGVQKEQDVWQGNYARVGFGETGYLIQSNILHTYDKATRQFGMEILDCRQNMGIAGMSLGHKECTFQDLGTMVFEDSTKKDWV